MSYFGKFLIIENDSKTLDVIQRDKSLLDKFPSSFVRSVSEATTLLEKSGKEIRMIFLSEKIAKNSDLTSLRNHGIQVSVLDHSSHSYMDLVKIFQKQLNEGHDCRKTANDGAEKDKEISSEDGKYIAIQMRDLVITPKSYF